MKNKRLLIDERSENRVRARPVGRCPAALIPFVVCVFFGTALLQPVFGISLEELTGIERAAVLKSSASEEAEDSMKSITEVQLKKPSPILMPSYGELHRLIKETMDNLEPNLFVETLTLYRKPSSQAAAAWSNLEKTGLFNQLVALSTLTGIQYYSASRKTMRTFYESSQIVDSPTNKKPLPDPVFSTLPVTLTMYARQKDLTFGDNTYSFDYYTTADAIIFVQENLTSMNAGIIPAVGKNRCRSVLAVIDAGDSLLLYAAAMARALSLPGMGERIGASFVNRMEAILIWFTTRANTVFQ